MRKLTPKQARFIDLFLQTRNTGAAAKQAGYSRAQAMALLKRADIAEAVGLLEKERDMAAKQKILYEIEAIAFARIDDFTLVQDGRLIVKNTAEIPRDTLAAIAGMRETTKGVELKLYDKQRALELLCKAHKVLEQDGEIEGRVCIIDDL